MYGRISHVFIKSNRETPDSPRHFGSVSHSGQTIGGPQISSTDTLSGGIGPYTAIFPTLETGGGETFRGSEK